MLTPIFSIIQDDDYLFISIKAPNARITETEIEFHDKDFRFYSKPYYLRLSLPSKIIESGQELADYDSINGTFLIKVSKLNKCEHFEGLDLLTKLLSNNNKQINKTSLIEVIDAQEANTEDANPLDSIDEDFDWHLEQTVRHESDELLLSGEKYGFADQYSGVMARIVDEFYDLIDLKEPEHKNGIQRREERVETERMDFSDDHYLSDLFYKKDIISELIQFETFVCDLKTEYKFDDNQRFKLKELPKKEFILEKSVKRSLILGMIDILFAFAYDMRVNECEPTVESGWNVCKLSPTLSWFDSFSSLKEVVIASIRRSLCYPLYRDWDLSLKVLSDVMRILELGQNYVLKCFLDIHKMFNESGDGRYVLNDLYITDYCVWLQYLKPNTFKSLVSALKTIQITKSQINLDLDLLERAAILAIQEQTNCGSNDTLLDNDSNYVFNYESSEESKELKHKTSGECSSQTTETYKHNDRQKDNDIDSDDDIPNTTNIIIDSNASDKESHSSLDSKPILTNISINNKN